MTEEKNLNAEVTDKIGQYVGLKGPGPELLAKLESDPALMSIQSAKEGLHEMRILFEYLEIMGVLGKVGVCFWAANSQTRPQR